MSVSVGDRRAFIKRMATMVAAGGSLALGPQLRMMGTALAATSPSSLEGYRALVCINLTGGNDAWNMLVPFDDARYSVYRQSRGGAYDPQENPGGLGLLQPATAEQIAAQVITDPTDGASYFFHPSAPELKSLYDSTKLAIVGNVGPLVRPITKAEYASPPNVPPQLFAHGDQTDLWQIGTAAESRYGWGGASAALLRAQFPPDNNTALSPCISIAGGDRFQTGQGLAAYCLSASSGPTDNPLRALTGFCGSPCGGSAGARSNALDALLNETYQPGLAAEYQATFSRAREIYLLLSGGFSSADGQVSTVFPTNPLADQLLTVARLIKLSRINNYAARQIFYVSLGGFDTHQGQMGNGTGSHASLLSQVSTAMSAFYQAMDEIGASNEVTSFTTSEFARTLSSNGGGSDHGWGSLHFVMGGDVVGGRLYCNGGGVFTDFPDESLDNAGNFSRGQFIPGIGVEQYSATLAKWLGVTSDADLAGIFPNLQNFNSAYRSLAFLP